MQRSTSLPVDQGLTIGPSICAAVVSIVVLTVAAAVPLFVRRSGEGASGAAAGRLRSGLVAGQVALSFVLMIAATLAVRSLLHLQGIDTGFTTDRRADDARRSELQQVPRRPLDRRVLAGGRAAAFGELPGVVGVGGTGVVPLDGQPLASSLYSVEGRASQSRE